MKYIVLLLLLCGSESAFAGRTIYVPFSLIPANDIGDVGTLYDIVCDIHNPSTKAQDVKVTSYVGGTWHYNTNTVGTGARVDSFTLKSLQSHNLNWGGTTVAEYGKLPRFMKIEVTQDDGFLIGACHFHAFDGPRHIPPVWGEHSINGGRPF